MQAKVPVDLEEALLVGEGSKKLPPPRIVAEEPRRTGLDPAQLASRNLSMQQVSQAIRSNNVTLPTGVLYGPARTYTV
ncbi:MAG: hypothetical protein ACRD5Z_07755, partial [Bryobacteraceae bacterium]